jgi:hypothetical protein
MRKLLDLLVVAVCTLTLAGCPGILDDDKWKIVARGQEADMDCVVIKATAMDPGRPKQLGEYATREQADTALRGFRQSGKCI